MSTAEVRLRLDPLHPVTKQGENIGVKLTFTGGAADTTLVLPMAADAGGILTYQVAEVVSGHRWEGVRQDVRSFAQDVRRPLPAGGKIELTHDALVFAPAPGEPGPPIPVPTLPAGTYRIVCTYDEGRTFSPENRGSRVLHSDPVEIVVTPP
jgi:hypothetical protein